MAVRSVWEVAADLVDPQPDGHRKAWLATARPEQLPPPGDWAIFFFRAGRGAGKLLAVGTPIPTPHGWSPIGALNTGDVVYDEAGRPCIVTGAYDVEVPDVCYRVRFSDGTWVDAADTHPWVTWTHAERKAFLRSPYEDASRPPADWPTWRLRRGYGHTLPQEVIVEALGLAEGGLSCCRIAARLGVSWNALARHLRAGRYVSSEPRVYPESPGPQVRTTREILDTLTYGSRNDTNHSIPVCGPLQAPLTTLPVDPYVLGVWLGDGHTKAATITVGRGDAETLDRIRAVGYTLTAYRNDGSRAPSYGVGGLHRHLLAAGVLGSKHIPPVYLRAAPEQRLALLQGLMDTDGSADNSRAEFTTTCRELASGVMELARTLGQKPTLTEGRARLYGRDCGPKWRIYWRPTTPVFRLTRKAARLTFGGAQAHRAYHRMIVDIDRIPSQPMRCISVDSPHRMYLAGEGMIPTHNTRAMAEDMVQHARELGPRCRVGLIGQTGKDVRDVLVEGESGVLACLPPSLLVGGSADRSWNRGLADLSLRLSNGAQMTGFSSERPRQLRGPQHTRIWGDEPATWSDAHKGLTEDTTMSNALLGLRLGPDPRACLSGTPRNVRLVKDLVADPRTVVTHATTYDNLPNLAPQFRQRVVDRYEGTTLGRQELGGEVLTEVVGALWQQTAIDRDRAAAAFAALELVVVGVDPSAAEKGEAAEAGVVVAAAGLDRHAYILDDYSGHMSPREWAAAAVAAYHDHHADVVVAEANNGGEMVRTTIATVDPTVPVELVHASRGKRTRAEPVAALYEQGGRVHHVGVFPDLEDQLCSWVAGEGDSPDRVDALVWAVSRLLPLLYHDPNPPPAREPADRWGRDREPSGFTDGVLQQQW